VRDDFDDFGNDFRGRFPRSGPPRPVKDGIRAHSKRGAFARSWWARRWIGVLEALKVGGRLSRGRSYARRGQVMDITIEEGLVRARVQGSRAEPYDVAIRVTPLSRPAWRRLTEVLRSEAVFLAKLLAGEMPPDIEDAFAKAHLSLFPTRLSELQTSCSCPDWSNPCKHIAAVYYLLGEEFDRDPFLIFRLRGITREELLRMVEEESGRAGKSKRPRKAATEGANEKPDEPAAAPTSTFWRAGELPPDLVPEPSDPAQAGALLTRLGPFPFWRGQKPLPDALLPAYGRAAAMALEILADLRSPGAAPRDPEPARERTPKR
jgi:uncharacterized Zn finger protein